VLNKGRLLNCGRVTEQIPHSKLFNFEVFEVTESKFTKFFIRCSHIITTVNAHICIAIFNAFQNARANSEGSQF